MSCKAKEQSGLENGSNELEVYYGLNREVQYCKRCVISNQRPSSTIEFKNRGEKKEVIFFDDEGICSACRYQDIKDNEIDWEEREKELKDLCDKYRSKNGSYDCIVPGSGGKDSAYTSHLLKYKYNMNPLTVTWAPHKYTDIGFKNLIEFIHSGFDNILFTPNGKLHRKLTQLAFLNLCHPFQPFIVGQRIIGPRYASMYNIPLVFYGENQAEYGNNIKENYKSTMDINFFSKDEITDPIIGGVPLSETIREFNFHLSDMQPYLPLFKDDVIKNKIEVHYLSYFHKWDPQENYYYAVENTNFSPNDQRTEGSFSKYSSIDDKIDPLHYYTTMAKFGLGRSSYDVAQEIRTGKLDREEGVLLVNKFDMEFPSRFYQEMLEYMDVSSEQFHEVVDNARSPHLWKYVDDKWELRYPLK